MKKDAGFTLIEIIVTLILLGIMGAIAGILIARGAQGYFMARETNVLSQKAQLAMDRMILEFEDISAIAAVSSTSVCYTLTYYDKATDTTLPDVYRCIGLVGSQIKIVDEALNGTTLPTATTGYVLVDNVSAFQLNFYSNTDAFTGTFTGNGTWTPPGSPVAYNIGDLAAIKITLTLNRTDSAGATYTCSTLYDVRRNGVYGRVGRDDMPINWNLE
jgi:prepilin-type N-terminal cleavage/methylation domain-containing protein